MSLFDTEMTYFDVKKLIDTGKKEEDGESTAADSWVDIAPSRDSLSSIELLATYDVDPAFRDFSSPISLRSSHVDVQPCLEQVKYRLVKEMPRKRAIDWIWDWESRPELISPRGPNIYSMLSTPPNSPDGSAYYRYKSRNSSFRIGVLLGLVVSNLVTFVIGAAIGYYMCKRLARDMKQF